MSEYLRTSLEYKQYSTASQTIAHWVESFKRSTENYTGHSFELESLTNLPEWQELTKSICSDYFMNATAKIQTSANKKSEGYYPCKINLNLSSNPNFDSHRSGWHFVLDVLKCLHNSSGVMVDNFVENDFCWSLKDPIQKPWIGFCLLYTSDAADD